MLVFYSCEDCVDDLDCEKEYEKPYAHKDKCVKPCNKGKNKGKDHNTPPPLKLDWDTYEVNENFTEFTDSVPTLCESFELCLRSKRFHKLGKVIITQDNDDNLYVKFDMKKNWEFKAIFLGIGVKDGENIDILPLTEYKMLDVNKLPYIVKFDEPVCSYVVKVNTKAYLGDKFDDCIIFVAGALMGNKKFCKKTIAWATKCEDYTEKKGCGFSIRDGKIARDKGGIFIEYCFDDFECDEPFSEDVDFTYAWEDLRNKGNDADYNDLVIQAVLNKVKDKLIFKFLPVARGAGYDHKFKFSIPNKGVVKVEGAATTEVVGDKLVVTVFESTKAVLPPEKQKPSGYSANVVYRGENEDCLATPIKESTVTVTIDDSYEYDAESPYDPFITVYTSGSTSNDSKDVYDLHVWQVTKTDTWTHSNGKVYPNGMFIPADWKWPKENQAIFSIYPDFNDISSWSNSWHTNIAKPDKVIEKNFCE